MWWQYQLNRDIIEFGKNPATGYAKNAVKHFTRMQSAAWIYDRVAVVLRPEQLLLSG